MLISESICLNTLCDEPMMSFLPEDVLKLLLSVIAGGFIGVEREYSSKAAGFRTIILISIGSTLFTILSIKLGMGINNDRIAANIITGIGFIGAGVVFKDGLSVTGITTAASIWATAALGMAIGSGAYLLALSALLLVILVLSLFEYVQSWIDNVHQVRSYRIVVNSHPGGRSEIETQLSSMRLHFSRKREMKSHDAVVVYYDVSGRRSTIDSFNAYLLDCPGVRSFEC